MDSGRRSLALIPMKHSCIHQLLQVEYGCPVCKSKYPKKARRNLHFMESVISIYKSLNEGVSVNLPQLQSPNNPNSQLDGGSKESEMIGRDVIKRSDSSSNDDSPPTSEGSNPRPKHHDWTMQQMLDFESENDGSNHTPESH